MINFELSLLNYTPVTGVKIPSGGVSHSKATDGFFIAIIGVTFFGGINNQ
jgi:hypothetical protein